MASFFSLRLVFSAFLSLTTTFLRVIAGSSASSYIIAQIEKLDLEKQILEKKLIAAEQSNRDAATAAETKESIYQSICHLLDNFDTMTYTEKNELLKNTVTACILEENGLHIIF